MDTATRSYRAHLKATLVLGLPLIGSHAAQMLVHLTDTLMVGWYGVAELASVVLASSVFFVFFIVGSGFAMAVMPMAAAAEGAGDRTRVRRIARMGVWISLLYCFAAMPVLWGFEALATAIGQNTEVAAIGQDYMRIAQWGMFPAMLIMVLKSFMSALERPALVLWGTILGGIANAFVNYAFIFGHWGAPEMGVRGAALASVITQTLTFALLAVAAQTLPAFRPYHLFTRIWRSDWPAFSEVFHLGWPIGATMLAEVGLFSASAVMMGWIGTRELATHGIAIQIASMAFMVYLGLANAVTIRTGRAYGRRDFEGITRAANVVIALTLGTAAVVITLMLAVPEVLIGVFLDSGNPDSAAIQSYGRGLLAIAAAFQVVDGLQVAGLSILRGLGDTRGPMIWAIVSYWIVGMPCGYLLGFIAGFGGYGIWSGLVIGLALAAVAMLARYRRLLVRLDFAEAPQG